MARGPGTAWSNVLDDLILITVENVKKRGGALEPFPPDRQQ